MPDKEGMKRLSLYFFLISLFAPFELNALEEHRFQGKEMKIPYREVSVIATEEGFYPPTVMVYLGEKVRFFVTTTTKDDRCFLLKEKEIFLPAKLGKMAEGEAIFDELGTYQFHCPTGQLSGTLIVKERPSDVEKRRRREIASQMEQEKAKFRHWVPKDN